MALLKFQTGFRLFRGEDLNAMVAILNGTVASTFKGLFNPTNGISMVSGGGSRVYHSGDAAPDTTTTGTDTTPVVTEVYISRVLIVANCTLTGIALLNGSAAAGNVQVMLYDGSGVLLANSASTAQSGTAGYQQIPFATPFAAKGPMSYHIGVAFSSTSARYRSHILGNFGAGKATGAVFGTPPNPITLPTGFTTNLGPIADTY